MATRIDAWRADNGSLHGNERSAVKSNVEHLTDRMIREAPALSHAAIAKWMIDNREDVIRVMSAYHRLHPAAMISQESKAPKVEKGPVAQKGPLDAEAISIEMAQRAEAAMTQMRKLGAPAKDWLAQRGFASIVDFRDRSGFDDVTAWENFVLGRKEDN